jgi:hypothetical protein
VQLDPLVIELKVGADISGVPGPDGPRQRGFFSFEVHSVSLLVKPVLVAA